MMKAPRVGLAILAMLWSGGAWAADTEPLWLGFTLPFVLVAVAGVAAWWLVKRRGLGWKRDGPLEIVQVLQLGSRERVLLVRAGEEYLVLGATPTQINLLRCLAHPPAVTRDVGADGPPKSR